MDMVLKTNFIKPKEYPGHFLLPNDRMRFHHHSIVNDILLLDSYCMQSLPT